MAEGDQLEIKQVCQKIQLLVRQDVNAARQLSWIGPTRLQTLEFVKRAAVVRQFEAASTILALVDSGSGATAVTFLRPAYEELLWLKYLEQNEDVALELVQLMTVKELRESYDAQLNFLGQKGIRQIGFTSRISKRFEHGFDPSDRLKALGKELGWRQGSLVPTVAFIARKVGREKEYNFLYHGTSRAVHFSVHELQRRIWGEYGAVEIGSDSFDRYWSDFAMSWSFRILVETLILTGFTGNLEKACSEGGVNFGLLLKQLTPVQILTASELESWSEPNVDVKGLN